MLALEASSLTCLLGPWFRELGFAIFYGSILIKLYRVLTEFQTRKAHRVCLRDKDQALYLSAIVLIVVGYMSGWTALMVDAFWFSSSDAQLGPSLASPERRFDQLVRLAPLQPNGSFADAGQQQLSSSAGEFGELLQTSQQQVARSHLMAAFQSGQASLGDEQTRRAQEEQDEEEAAAAAGAAEEEQLLLVRHSGDGQSKPVFQAANEQLGLLAHSFGELFLGLLETQPHFDAARDELVYSVRCRKLTWDYVTEASEYRWLCLLAAHFGANS